jgi:CRISPR/Cas system CMR-associated protein Cmr5 small subunit
MQTKYGSLCHTLPRMNKLRPDLYVCQAKSGNDFAEKKNRLAR